jgi:hypothetical protein
MQAMEDARKVAKAILEAGEAPPDSNGRVLRRSADGHNDDRRPGVPLIGRGVAGARVDTNPVAALMRKETQLERRR